MYFTIRFHNFYDEFTKLKRTENSFQIQKLTLRLHRLENFIGIFSTNNAG